MGDGCPPLVSDRVVVQSKDCVSHPAEVWQVNKDVAKCLYTPKRHPNTFSIHTNTIHLIYPQFNEDNNQGQSVCVVLS